MRPPSPIRPSGLALAGRALYPVARVTFPAGRPGEAASSRLARLALGSLAILVAFGCSAGMPPRAIPPTGGDPSRGRTLVDAYGCGQCHTVSGVRSARGRVGPPLDGVADRTSLAGTLENTP